jgi:tRNA(Ile)-lysidine synthase TilS/MesJ
MQLQNILRGIRKADQEFHLIEPGDSIAVALSGGKDSMLLFLALSQYQKFKGKDFKLCGIHVDVGFEDFDHELMQDFCKENGLDLHIEKTKIFDILKLEQHVKDGKIQCSLCSTLKKGVLFEKAQQLGCSKVAFGHHGDDAVETLFLNMIHGSKIATFQPLQYMSRMDMAAIRPMVYCREKEIIQACKANDIPSVRRVCPNDGYTQRQSVKELLETIYSQYPSAYDNFLRSLSNQEQIALWNPDVQKKKEKENSEKQK